ncbi:MAG: hypothetical protein RJA70_4104 [Pseudomonadota bacterium]|jgi:hypothetical protein
MNRLDELEDEILQRTRRAYSPSAASQARIQATTLAAISAGALVQTASLQGSWLEAGREAVERVQSTWSWRGALTLGLALGGAGVGGYALGLREGQSRVHVTVLPAVVPVAPASPTHVETPPADRPSPQEPPPVLAPEGRKQRSLDAEPSSSASVSPAEVELGLLRRVERVLRMGDPRFALVLLGELDQKVPKGKFMEERLAARTTATCQRDGAEAASQAAASFFRRFPNSVYGARVREACGAAAPGGSDKSDPASEQIGSPPETHNGKGVTKP